LEVETSRTFQYTPLDPNDIIGPAGFGNDHFVLSEETLPYTIHFENKAMANAAAQVVRITQQLDADLDFRTFELGDFGFGDFLGRMPEGLSTLRTRIDARATAGVFVDVAADIDFITGLVTWAFTSIDPVTFDLPTDPVGGFLPPNRTSPQGEGFVSYRIRPRSAAATGTRVDARATVVFDEQPPLDTPAIFNTVDAGAPTSSVSALPATTPAPDFTVSWSGSDDAGIGSGIASYDVYISDNGGPFAPFLVGTVLTSATVHGVPAHTYGFYSVATDNAGHRQPTPATAQATTQVATVAPAVMDVFAVGSGAGGAPMVRVYNADRTPRFSFLAYDPAFRGGVSVATADVTGDGVQDVITGAGPGGGPHVRVFDGRTGALVREFFAYDPAFRGGVQVAAGDMNGDGKADIVTGAGVGGGPHVKVFNGASGALVWQWMAYDSAFRGGVNVAAGDVTGDGLADVVTGAGVGGGPHVRVFDGRTGALDREFFAYDAAFRGGVHVAAGDLSGDGPAEVVTAPGPGGGPHVKVYDGARAAILREFFAYDSAFRGGVALGISDANDDGTPDIVAGPGPGGGPIVKVYDGRTFAEGAGLAPFDPNFRGGIFVG
jgi:hypothetical protein